MGALFYDVTPRVQPFRGQKFDPDNPWRVGDKLLRTMCDFRHLKIGDVVTVTRATNFDTSFIVYVAEDRGSGGYDARNFELIERAGG